MSTKQDRIANLLVQGMAPTMIAAIVGCDPSYISSLLKDETFQYCLQGLKDDLATGEATLEDDTQSRKQETLLYVDRLQGAQHAALDKVIKELPYMNGREALMAIDILGKRQEASLATLSSPKHGFGSFGDLPPGTTVRMVELTVPSICVPELTISGSSEIIALGDRSVAPMSTHNLRKMLSKANEVPLEVPYEDHTELAAAL